MGRTGGPADALMPSHINNGTADLVHSFQATPAPAGRVIPTRLLENSSVALERRVAARFEYGAYAAVRSFLVTHHGVSELLLEAVPVTERIFGNGTNITLIIVNDHDTDDGEGLVARIQTQDSVATAREKRKRLYREWWNSCLDRADGRLHFDLDFV